MITTLPRRFRASALSAALATVVIQTAACTGVIQPGSPFTGDEASFRTNVATICIQPVDIAVILPEAEERAAEFEKLIHEVLGTTTYELLTAEVSRELWQRTARAMGGAFDPHLGTFDRAKHREIRAEFLRQLAATHHCDAILEAVVSLVTVGFNSSWVVWDGLRDHLPGAGGLQGWLPSLSLWVTLRDMEDEEIYFNTGGIEFARGLAREGFFQTAKFEVPEPESLLRNEQANRLAVELSLAPVLGQPSDVRDSGGLTAWRTRNKAREDRILSDTRRRRGQHIPVPQDEETPDGELPADEANQQ